MRLLIVDNYDSFTYNLQHLLEPLIAVNVIRNDAIDLDSVEQYSHIVLSPGPGLPSEAGMLNAIIRRYFGKKPMLGVCLGMQAIAEYSGGILYNQEQVKHGIAREIEVTQDSKYLFKNLPKKMEVGLYHSWAIKPESLSKAWIQSAYSTEGVLMAIEHVEYPIAGVQFHPESIMTPSGKTIVENWLNQNSI